MTKNMWPDEGGGSKRPADRQLVMKSLWGEEIADIFVFKPAFGEDDAHARYKFVAYHANNYRIPSIRSSEPNSLVIPL